jgi:hypothetical protein
MSYQDDLKEHLAEYKRSGLGISEPGIFRYRGRNVRRSHILPLANSSLNLLEEASSFFASYPKVRRHRDFHHLNSSQAFAINLFFPYFSGKPESSEVKLSETEFGKAIGNDRRRVKLIRYSETLKLHLEGRRLAEASFFEAYQFNRNVWHMVREDRSRLMFLLPRANAILWTRLDELLSGVMPQTRKRISAVAIEDVIGRLSTDGQCPDAMRVYANRLKEKYLI